MFWIWYCAKSSNLVLERTYFGLVSGNRIGENRWYHLSSTLRVQAHIAMFQFIVKEREVLELSRFKAWLISNKNGKFVFSRPFLPYHYSSRPLMHLDVYNIQNHKVLFGNIEVYTGFIHKLFVSLPIVVPSDASMQTPSSPIIHPRIRS